MPEREVCMLVRLRGFVAKHVCSSIFDCTIHGHTSIATYKKEQQVKVITSPANICQHSVKFPSCSAVRHLTCACINVGYQFVKTYEMLCHYLSISWPCPCSDSLKSDAACASITTELSADNLKLEQILDKQSKPCRMTQHHMLISTYWSKLLTIAYIMQAIMNPLSGAYVLSKSIDQSRSCFQAINHTNSVHPSLVQLMAYFLSKVTHESMPKESLTSNMFLRLHQSIVNVTDCLCLNNVQMFACI